MPLISIPAFFHHTRLAQSDSYWYSVHSLLLNETFVFLVRLIPVAVLFLGSQLLGQLVENDRQELRAALLVVGVPVPDGNLYSVPANTVRDSADVIIECYHVISIRWMRSQDGRTYRHA